MTALKIIYGLLAAVCIGIVVWLVAGDVQEYYKKIEINTKGK